MRQKRHEKAIIKATQKWAFGSLLVLPAIHAGAAYVFYLLVVAAMPRFSSGAWLSLGAFVTMLVLGVLILAVTNNLHDRARNKTADDTYIHKRIPRSLEYTDVAGLLNLTIGLLGSMAIIMFFGFHAFSVGTWVLAGIFFVSSGLGITIGYHRYATHDSFECGPLFGRFMLFCGAMALQGGVIKWAIDHLIHHDRTEIEQEDPHTPHESFIHSHMGWLFRPYVYTKDVIEYFATKTKSTYLLHEQKKYYPYAVAFGLAGPFLLFGMIGVLFGEGFSLHEAVMAFLFAGLFRLTVVYHTTWSVNSVSHTWGPHSYEGKATGDSTDVWMLAPISFGENLQNIHHLLPNFAYYGIKWYYFDASGLLLLLLAWTNKKVKALRWRSHKSSPP